MLANWSTKGAGSLLSPDGKDNMKRKLFGYKKKVYRTMIGKKTEKILEKAEVPRLLCRRWN